MSSYTFAAGEDGRDTWVLIMERRTLRSGSGEAVGDLTLDLEVPTKAIVADGTPEDVARRAAIVREALGAEVARDVQIITSLGLVVP